MADGEAIGRVGLAVWVDDSAHHWDTWDERRVLGVSGDDSYLVEIEETNRERIIREIIDGYRDGDRGLRIELAFFGAGGGFFASPLNFLEHWPRSPADVPAHVFVDDHYKATFASEGGEIVMSVRHVMRPGDGPTKRRLRFLPNVYEEAMSRLVQESRRLREDLIAAAKERAPQKVGALLEAVERWPV